MKIIFYNGTPLSNTYGEKINLKWFSENGYEVELWNLSPIYYSEKNINNYFKFGYKYEYFFYNEKIFTTKKEVIKALNKEDKNTIFNSMDFGNHDHYWILRQFKILNLKLSHTEKV